MIKYCASCGKAAAWVFGLSNLFTCKQHMEERIKNNPSELPMQITYSKSIEKKLDLHAKVLERVSKIDSCQRKIMNSSRKLISKVLQMQQAALNLLENQKNSLFELLKSCETDLHVEEALGSLKGNFICEPLIKIKDLSAVTNYYQQDFIVHDQFKDTSNKIYSLETGQKYIEDKYSIFLEDYAAPIDLIALSSDDAWIVIRSNDNSLRIFEVANKKLIQVLRGAQSCITVFILTRSKGTIVAGCEDGKIMKWQLEEKNKFDSCQAGQSKINTMVMTNDSTRILTGSEETIIKIWEISSLTQIDLIETNSGVIWLCFSEDNSLISASCSDKTLSIWNFSEKKLEKLVTSKALITRMAISQDNSIIAAGSSDKQLSIWPIQTSEQPSSLLGHTDAIKSIIFSNSHIITASSDRKLRIFNANTKKLEFTSPVQPYPLNCLSLTSDHKSVYLSSMDIKLFNLTDHTIESIIFGGHTDSLTSLLIDAKNKVYTGSKDKTIRIWSLKSGHSKGTLQGHTGSVILLILSYDNKKLISASLDKTIRVWSLIDKKQIGLLQGFNGNIRKLVLTYDDQTLISSIEDKTLRFWSLAQMKQIFIVNQLNGDCGDICVSNDSKFALTGYEDKTIKLWGIVEKKLIKSFVAHLSPVTGFCIGHNDQVFASGAADGSIKLWSFGGMEILIQLAGHVDAIDKLRITCDDKFLVSASKDKSVKVWDLTTLAEVELLASKKSLMRWEKRYGVFKQFREYFN